MDALLSRNRRSIFILMNGGFAVLVALLGSMQHAAAGGTVVYLCALFALCSAPVWFLDRLNGRYTMLAILMALFFVFFGMLDFLTLLLGGELAPGSDELNAGEGGILAGGVCALLGYVFAARLPAVASPTQSADWPRLSVLLVGLGLWLIGSISIVYFDVFLVTEKTIESSQRGLAAMGPLQTFFVMLGHLLGPLGLLILAYGYARFRVTFWLLVILFLLAAQVVLAFVADVRGFALTPVAVVIVAITLVDNKIPKGWVLGAAIGIALVFPLLSAYRATVSGEHGLNRAEAAANLEKVFDLVLAYQDRMDRQESKPGGPLIFQRASLKGNIELEFARVGVDAPFQEGQTLIAIPLAFIPRLIWPDKPDVSTGQLFNHEIFHSEVADTYISPSHLGELYWNYGWPGLLGGMFIIGSLLGFVAAKCCLAERMSVTRLLIMLATVQYLCWGFEGVMSVSYISWMRSIAAIGLLHLLLAKRSAPASVAPSASPVAQAVLPRFPNLLR
jgi:hypothetical protein